MGLFKTYKTYFRTRHCQGPFQESPAVLKLNHINLVTHTWHRLEFFAEEETPQNEYITLGVLRCGIIYSKTLLATLSIQNMIPNIFHFVFGLAPDFGGKPFLLPHYLAIKSAVEINNPTAVLFHYEFEPTGEWWEKAKQLLTLNKIKSPDSFKGQPLHHVAHKADLVRLVELKKTGGIYLDMDTICVKPMNDLLNHSFVIGEELNAEFIPKNWRQRIKHSIKSNLGGKEPDQVNGLCNAVLLSTKESPFLDLWMETYGSFRSKGMDKYWNEHSVSVPIKLAALHPDKITVLEPFAFHYPLYDKPGLTSMFETVTDFPRSYVHHLWQSFSWGKYLSCLSVKEIFEKDTTYNLIARRFL